MTSIVAKQEESLWMFPVYNSFYFPRLIVIHLWLACAKKDIVRVLQV